ncbi:MAG: hypothetical protein IPK50_09700 [Fibrobacterota bacterium]|nr:hypothetical protein [Fibrobacterota bacterium]QQS07152.1 MAG: hypothetical protein IPK50_09700 [Fibrobacterota bacterium]
MKQLTVVLALAGWLGATPLAVVLRTEGSVEMGLARNLKPAKVGELVRSEWVVKTAPGAKARLRMLADQATIDLAGGTALELRVIQRHDRILRRAYLLSGEATIEAGDQSSDLRIETQTTITNTTGGLFGVTMKPDGETTVHSKDGAAKVCNPETGEHERLTAGMMVTSTWDGILSSPKLLPPVSVVAPIDSARKDSLVMLNVRLSDPVTGKTSMLQYRFKVER